MARSQVIDNDLNPKWDEEFKLLVHEPEHQVNHQHCNLHTRIAHPDGHATLVMHEESFWVLTDKMRHGIVCVSVSEAAATHCTHCWLCNNLSPKPFVMQHQ